jgi:hypothetical protein
LNAVRVSCNLSPGKHRAAPAHLGPSQRQEEQHHAQRVLQVRHRAQAGLTHALRVRRGRTQIHQGDPCVIPALRELPAELEQPSATLLLRPVVLPALHLPPERGPVPRAHRDSALTQLIQLANSVPQEVTQPPKGAPSASRAQREDLAVLLELLRVLPVKQEPSQEPTVQPLVPRVVGEPSLLKLAPRIVLRAPGVQSRIRHAQSAFNLLVITSAPYIA